MKLMLADDNLDIRNEVEVSDALMKWLQVQWDAGHKVHLNHLLPLIRWSGVSIDYIKSNLLPNTFLSDQESRKFLTNVMRYLTSGVQFKGLQTFHRPSTGVENCMLTFGLRDNQGESNTLCRINLQHPDDVTTLTEIPTVLHHASDVCLIRDTLYVTGIGIEPCKQVWKWNLSSGWTRCADMLQGQMQHCAAVFDSTLYVLGGMNLIDGEISGVEKYDTEMNEWSRNVDLCQAVGLATCVTYKNSIYVFGGRNSEGEVLSLQMYNPRQNSCIVMFRKIPQNYRIRKEPLMWETSVILIGAETCFIYNFESQEWHERRQFGAGILFFAATLDNGIVYVAGGGVYKPHGTDWGVHTDEVKCVPVSDIIEDKPAVWKHHAKLPKPARILAYTSLQAVSLPLI